MKEVVLASHVQKCKSRWGNRLAENYSSFPCALANYISALLVISKIVDSSEKQRSQSKVAQDRKIRKLIQILQGHFLANYNFFFIIVTVKLFG